MKRRDIKERAVKGMREAKGFLHDFKAFATRGNVFDLAVGVIIGGAFGKITSSLVADVIMPLFGLLLGGFNFQEWKYVLPNVWNSEEPPTVNIGIFVQSLVDFIIIAFCVFLFIRLAAKLREKPDDKDKKEEPEPEPKPPEEVLLLREIRDLLKQDEK